MMVYKKKKKKKEITYSQNVQSCENQSHAEKEGQFTHCKLKLKNSNPHTKNLIIAL